MKLSEPQKRLLLQIARTGRVNATQLRTYEALCKRKLVRNKTEYDLPAPQAAGFDSFTLTDAGLVLLEQIKEEDKQAIA